MPVFLTTDEVARVIRCTPYHVRDLIRAGELPASRTGKRRLVVEESDLQRFVASRRVCQGPTPEVRKAGGEAK